MPYVDRPLGIDIIRAVAVMHLVVGLLLLSTSKSVGPILTASLYYAFWGNRRAAGAALIAGALLSLWGVYRNQLAALKLFMLVPQQALLFIPAAGAVWAICAQHYEDCGWIAPGHDCVYRPWEFILPDQAAILVIFYVHARGIWRRARATL